jgi:hypothetical protein
MICAAIRHHCDCSSSESTGQSNSVRGASPTRGSVNAPAHPPAPSRSAPCTQAARPVDRLQVLQTSAIYQATADQKERLFGEVFTTDGRIPQLGLTVLQDDKLYHPLYNAAPTMRKEAYDRNPDIAKVLAPISAALVNEVVAELNRQRSAEGKSARRVARDWLSQQGCIAKES